MSPKIALITGVGGQDGSYLSEFLLKAGYIVHGVVRRSSYPHTERVDHLIAKYDERDPSCPFRVHYMDLTDVSSIRNVIEKIQPDELFNLAAQSHVAVSFLTGESTIDINALGPFRLLDTVKNLGATIKYYQASSSEMFGASPPPQNENTPFLPQSPYGVAKVAAFYLTRLYRIAYGMYASNGILFNHESPRRGVNFVTRKVTRGIASIITGEIVKLYMGNLESKRDWGFSGDYVEAMWRILQHERPDDFVIATEETYSVREFLEEAFDIVGLSWEDFVVYDKRYLRPAEVPALMGDATKARKLLNWRPKVKFKELCYMMVESDLKAKGLTILAAKRKAGRLKRLK